MGNKKKLPVGVDSFNKLVQHDFYYIDKTGLLVELLKNWAEVNLFTRPRRFGKSLNMSMLQTFFEIGCDKTLFDGLKISEEKELCQEYMGQFPVISISLKGVEGQTFQEALAAMKYIIGQEALRFSFLLESDRLSDKDKDIYQQLTEIGKGTGSLFAMTNDVLGTSLKTLSDLLCRHYGKNVILLIDEYDVPLDKAFQYGYYDQMVSLLRVMFGNALKTNPSLYFAVLTGCLRISKESIFTGLNNLKTLTITNAQFDEYFGFTDKEVKEMLAYYDLEEHYETMKEWYDGYRFGNVDVYCPWDVVNYCDAHINNPGMPPKNYWLNTSGNDIIYHFIDGMGDKGQITRTELERLVNGNTVQKEISQELTYKELYDSIDNIWSTLFMTGYLTQRGEPDGNRYELAIPNREIRNIITEHILKRFQQSLSQDGTMLENFCNALQSGRAEEVEKLLTAYMKRTVSVRDTFVQKPAKENFYHGMLLGILGYKNDWLVRSNREAGDGFSDIMILIDDAEEGIVIEIKYAEEGMLDKECEKALKQIIDKNYTQELEEAGVKKILKYGISCNKKGCRVLLQVQ